MSAPVPTVEPTIFSAGDTLEFTRELTDYPAGFWSLTYVISNAGNVYTISSTADGLIHHLRIQSQSSASWIPGEYQMNGYVTATIDDVIQQHAVYSATLTILRNKASMQPAEFRTWAEIALSAIETALVIDAGRGAALEYTINGRSIRASFEQAIKMRDYLKAEVALLTNASGRHRKILTRFRAPRNSATEPFV